MIVAFPEICLLDLFGQIQRMYKHLKKQIIASANKKILYLPHAIKRMSQPERMITVTEIKEAVKYGEIIEQYPEDKRGVSCLVLYFLEKRAIHVVCAPRIEYLAIITAYIPAADQWSSDFRVRK